MNTKDFHLTTGKELLALKDRVRHLISHWGEDGRYKEAVLKTVIQRFLPTKFTIATGFVVKQTETRGEHLASSQIDLLIYDNSFPILFKENDFVIVTPDAVSAIIEVKANLENQGISKVAEKSNRIGEFIYKGKADKSKPFFNGIFSYEGFDTPSIENIKNHIEKADHDFLSDQEYIKYKVNHISFNQNWFLKFWEQELSYGPNWVYEIAGLSFSFFIGNLMNYLSEKSIYDNSNIWFPVDKSIEVKKMF
jgi:hypothetical protein